MFQTRTEGLEVVTTATPIADGLQSRLADCYDWLLTMRHSMNANRPLTVRERTAQELCNDVEIITRGGGKRLDVIAVVADAKSLVQFLVDTARGLAEGGIVHAVVVDTDLETGSKLAKKAAVYCSLTRSALDIKEVEILGVKAIQIIGIHVSFKPKTIEANELDDAARASIANYVHLGTAKADCSIKARACDDCSCGRKELEADFGAEEGKRKYENLVKSQSAPKSNCGSCGLGDAFRCDGCPYKGRPAFVDGKLTIIDDL